MRIVEAVVRDHVENAAHLWTQLDDAETADPFDQDWVNDLRPRLAAHLHGLALAGHAAWPIAVEAVEAFPDKGEHFAAAYLALSQDNRRWLSHVADLAEATDEGDVGVIGALAHVAPGLASPTVRDWLAAKSGHRRYLAVATLRKRGLDPHDWLAQLIGDSDPRVRREACRVAGARGRVDMLEEVEARLRDDDATVQDRAAEACVALGRGELAIDTLKGAVLRHGLPTKGGLGRTAALRALALALTPGAFRDWLGQLSRNPDTVPVSVRGLGMVRDQKPMTWLIRQMATPEVCVAAAQAFLELHGPVEEMDELFYTDGNEAAAELGAEFEHIDQPVPIPARFEALLATPTPT